jgi:ABC-2 type transport system permease protein
MFNLLKYEIRARYVFILGGIAVLSVLNIFLFMGCNFIWVGKAFSGAAVALSALAGFAAVVVYTVDGIKILTRDLFSDTGYLLFSLPKKGLQIISSKLIMAVGEFMLFSSLTVLFISIHALIITKGYWNLFLPVIFNNIPGILAVIFSFVASFASFVVLVFFSIVLARSILSNRKYGKLMAFGLFIALTILHGYIEHYLIMVFPQTIGIGQMLLDPGSLRGINASGNFDVGGTGVNIASLVLYVVEFIALLLGSSYLVEKRVVI